MEWGLRNDLRFCLIGDRTIFLDLTTERYFGLPAALDRAFHHLLGRAPLSADDERTLQPLVSRGLLVPGGSAAQPTEPACELRAAVDLRASLPDRASPFTIALAFQSEIITMLGSRRLSLRNIAKMLDRWRNRAPARKDPSRPDIETYLALAAAFERTALLLRPADRCLITALAFLRACRSRDLFPSLVFGVRANPFAAHCWVQHQTLILNDELERVRIYTPILVL